MGILCRVCHRVKWALLFVATVGEDSQIKNNLAMNKRIPFRFYLLIIKLHVKASMSILMKCVKYISQRNQL